MPDLQGTIAVVTGASRGAGRGIALALGAAGATVYVTGRSVQGRATNNWPGTIEETAAAVTAAGGVGIPVRCDHTVDAEVAALFVRVQQEHSRLDVLVNNAWGGNALAIHADPFWELVLEHWQHMFTAGVRATIVSSRYAIPLMLPQRQGLIVNISFWDRDKYTGHLFYDLAKHALNRLAYGMAVELRAHHIAVVAVAPGWMRTELVLAAFQTDEEHYHQVEALKCTESPHYVGRAIVALAADPVVLQKSGQILRVGDLAREYGFTDVDGTQPLPFEFPDSGSSAVHN